ncbi:hypothetical protein [Paenibacillus sp. MMO-58]|uniref:hypothetical protein n=1 Tax=Paenibacillus sp. MMO-58 TaxID=3081290 RepID=UPI003019A085
MRKHRSLLEDYSLLASLPVGRSTEGKIRIYINQDISIIPGIKKSRCSSAHRAAFTTRENMERCATVIETDGKAAGLKFGNPSNKSNLRELSCEGFLK